jgi:uncharacterized protein
MKKLLILLFSILISFNSYGGLFDKTVCVETETVERSGLIYLLNKTKPFSGKDLCKYENGQNKHEGKIKEGVKDGKWTYWFENGQIKIERKYKDGVDIDNYICFVGKEDYYFSRKLYYLPNEDKPFTGNTKCLIENRVYYFDYDKIFGVLVTSNKFKEGIPVHRHNVLFQKSGIKVFEMNQDEHMKRVDKFTEWYESGQIKQETNYNKEGLEDGKWTEWYENGDIYSESNWKDGECISGDCPD